MPEKIFKESTQFYSDSLVQLFRGKESKRLLFWFFWLVFFLTEFELNLRIQMFQVQINPPHACLLLCQI